MTVSAAMKRFVILVTVLLVASACTTEDLLNEVGLYTNPCPQGDSFADRQEVKRLQEEEGVNCVRTGGNDGSSSGASESAQPPTTFRKTQPEAAVPSLAPKETVTSTASSSPGESTYTFRQDDTLWSIAERFLGSGSRWTEIAELNGIGNPNEIPNGLVLLLPDRGTTQASDCPASQANALVNEVNALTSDYLEMEAPQDASHVRTFFDQKKLRLTRLKTKVNDWGQCLGGAPRSIRSLHEAFGEWAGAAGSLDELERECYLEIFEGVGDCDEELFEGPVYQRWLHSWDGLMAAYATEQSDSANFQEPTATTSPTASFNSSTSCSSDKYRNVDGQCVRRPTVSPGSGYTARCRDGTYSYSKNRQGTCSHHGGVRSWG